jgi:RimJ/RimL family protein N-acetyltransferase
MVPPRELSTPRLLLRAFRDEDIEPLHAVNVDPLVNEHLRPIVSREETDQMVGRIRAQYAEHGFGLWVVEAPGIAPVVGFIGVSRVRFEAPFTPAFEIGWRFAPSAWGRGYATEGAQAALTFARQEGVTPLVAMTVPANRRSQRVMEKLGMTRTPADDFDHPLFPAGHPLRPHILYRAPAQPPTTSGSPALTQPAVPPSML